MIPFDLYKVADVTRAEVPYVRDVVSIGAHPLCHTDDGQRDHLTVALGQAPSAGYVIECGVADGFTINHLASLIPQRTVWGFDSFYGLPEYWNEQHPAGKFSRDGKPPEVASNVKLCVGMFADTIPVWLQENRGNISFLHVDCDLYSSTSTVLRMLNERIVPGTIIVFDDMTQFDGIPLPPPPDWRAHEWIALEDWTFWCRREFAVVSRLSQCCLAIRILK